MSADSDNTAARCEALTDCPRCSGCGYGEPGRDGWCQDCADTIAAKRPGCWRCNGTGRVRCEITPDVVLENISAAIDWCFNPRDDDASQDSILIDALLSAARFIADQPCACDPVDPHEDGPCPRCIVLGRLADKREDR